MGVFIYECGDGGGEPASRRVKKDWSSRVDCLKCFNKEGMGQTESHLIYPLVFITTVGRYDTYPEKMTRSTGLSGVLPLRAVYLSVGESEITCLKVRRSNSTGAFLGTFKLFAWFTRLRTCSARTVHNSFHCRNISSPFDDYHIVKVIFRCTTIECNASE